MAAAFLKPDVLNGPGQQDDLYLALVQRHGDTTDASAQVAALQYLGLQAQFRTDGCIDHQIEQLQRGIPCPVGWLHQGPVSAPTGGGHWSLVIGWDPAQRQFLMHDLNGEADFVNGATSPPPSAVAKPSAIPSVTGVAVAWWKEPAAAGGFGSTRGPETPKRGEHFKQLRPSPMTFTPTMATIPLHSVHHVRLGLQAQLRQCRAMYSALPTEANRYHVVRLARLLLSL